MRIWRISSFADLSGTGGSKFAGRWHNKGQPIVYTSEHPALAMLETLVHINSGELPNAYKLLEIDAPKSIRIQVAKLQPDWQANLDYSRELGDAWLAEMSSEILQVPSAIMPHATNYLINPLHPEVRRIAIVRAENYEFDQRLK